MWFKLVKLFCLLILGLIVLYSNCAWIHYCPPDDFGMWFAQALTMIIGGVITVFAVFRLSMEVFD